MAQRPSFAQKKILSFILIALIFLELFLYIHREHPRRFDSFPKVPYIEFLKSQDPNTRSYGNFWVFYPNTATGFGVDDLGYFLGLVPTRFVEFVNTLVIDNHFQKDLRPPALRAMPIGEGKSHILDLLNVRYIIAPSEKKLSALLSRYTNLQDKLNLVYAGEVNIFERPSALPRAYVVHRAIFEPDTTKALYLISRLGSAGREGVIITHQPNPQLTADLNTLPLEDNSTVKILDTNPNEVHLQAIMENAGFVVLSDAYHPDWKVYINGQTSKIFQTNHLVRSVFVPAGRHEIKFIFIPISFYAGMIVSFLSLALIILLLTFPKFSLRKMKPQTKSPRLLS